MCRRVFIVGSRTIELAIQKQVVCKEEVVWEFCMTW